MDALGGTHLKGHVLEIAPATGSEFSVLKADNATGNFTKVVQRLPIKISIDEGQPEAARLRPGMSVVVRLDTAQQSAQQATQKLQQPVQIDQGLEANKASSSPASTPAEQVNP